ncbi:hypothetical protein [Arthrobacter sp.]|uniref:hypothetical protein n=1 Tax=Arthrobacter sp. TaxID=1667 RepID=UPI0033994AD4
MDRPAAADEMPLDVSLTDEAGLDLEQVLALYDAVGWSAYTLSPQTVSASGKRSC